jgi:hypothetical protein
VKDQKRFGLLALIPLTILASNNLKPTLMQRIQETYVATPDATAVDIPINYSQVDSNYFKTQKDSSYITQ